MTSIRPARSLAARPLAALLAILLVVQLPGIAAADHGGRDIGSFLACDRPVTPPRCTSVGNDLIHYVALDDSLTEGLAAGVRHAIEEVYGPTRLVMREQTEVTLATDVIAFSTDYGENGAAGWVYCPTDAPQGVNAAGDRWCRHQEMHFNINPRYAAFFDDQASRDHVTCHEIGHSLGLHHWGNPPQSDGPAGATCMNANTPNGPTTLHPIDVDHINDYPYTRWPRPRGLRVVRGPEEEPTMVAAALGAIAASGAEQPTSTDALAAAADAIVRGRIVEVAAGRVFGTPERPFHYAAASVVVDALVAGSLPPGHAERLTLEIPLFAGLETLPVLRAGLIGEERVLFLRNKGASAAAAGMSAAAQRADAPFYGLVTHDAELLVRGGHAWAGEDAALVEPFVGRPIEEVVEVLAARDAP